MAKYVLAVSGGVDSVVLLDMLVNGQIAEGTSALRGLQGEGRFLEFTSKNQAERRTPPEIVIAHFDHGIRPESAQDAEFVEALAKKYHLPFEMRREELGQTASEELARERRYAFLRQVAKKHNAKIVTAHHADDMIETIAINLTRGTGWRGLAVLDSPDIERPLLGKTKNELIEYAQKHGLEWREDATNNDTKYLRNALRQELAQLDDETRQLLQLYHHRQVALRRMVNNEIDILIKAPYSRYFLTNVPVPVGLEILRAIVVKETGQGLTRPRLGQLLIAVKTYQPGKTFDIDASHVLRFSRSDFVVLAR